MHPEHVNPGDPIRDLADSLRSRVSPDLRPERMDPERDLPWPPESITDLESLHNTVIDAHAVTERCVLMGGPDKEFAQVAFDEEMYAARLALREPSATNHQHAQDSLTMAAQLQDFIDGDQNQAAFVTELYEERRAALDQRLDRLGEGPTRAEIADEFGLDIANDADQELINQAELWQSEMTKLRSAFSETETDHSMSEGQPTFPTPPETQGQLFKYEREQFPEFDPAKVEQFRAFIDAQLRVHHAKLETARSTGRNVTYQDRVTSVLGNGGSGVEFLIGAGRAAGHRIEDVNQFLAGSFVEAVKAYLDYDLLETHPEYHRDFRRTDRPPR